ncbi:MAG TPA: 3-deoxy-7-phosphoheptulonate synthase [Candidatus Hydrogenedentes bacterium]|nr:3-deoxy-7-phosphoheptulonate synthase [Candidatus Hydrogenedentota bacterium]HPG67876.1 3-deoxy-7-phosphoheptulonate synthase [Candidatus Hydrogenedentota bacterium]
MWRTDNLNVVSVTPLITPQAMKDEHPITAAAAETVYTGRKSIANILSKIDPRMLVVVGPCSIHDPAAALDYAARLAHLRKALGDRFELVMRAYFEKPRTTLGWKGLINDPYLDGSCDLGVGLRKARQLLVAIAELGVPTATEVLDPIVPQYIADLLSWASIGARTTESQTHREMASGLSMPVGFKNGTDGNLQIAINGLVSCRQAHHFLGIDQEGRTCVIETQGNKWGNIILRGGGGRPNYDPVSVADAEESLRRAGLEPLIVVDCSHANCGKRQELQAHVLRDVIQQRIEGNHSLIGVMLESNIEAGSQPLQKDITKLRYGVSVTDPCMGWTTTEELLRYAHRRLAEDSAFA